VQCHHPKYKYTTPKIPFLEWHKSLVEI
jgi:hypothetical protein